MISKIKDLIYDFNDIVVALLILAVAGGVITWRVADIMAYPEYLAKQQEILVADKPVEPDTDLSGIDLTPEPVNPSINPNPEGTGSSESGEPGQTGTEDPSASTDPPAPPPATGETKITVPAGSYASKIAEILYDAGLISSTQEFIDTLVEQKADTKLKAGTFTIPAGSTMEEIIKILIK